MKAAAYVWVLVSLCRAQTGSLEGELRTREAADKSHLVVRLETPAHIAAAETFADVGGDFRFRQVAEGTYSLVVTDELGREIARQPVQVRPSNPQLKIELPEDPRAAHPGATVSVSELRHQPVPKALRAVRKAGSLSKHGDYRGAAALLEKAVAWDPQFAGAHGNLGVQYARLFQPARAAAEFRQAVALDPSNAMEQANLALVLAQLGHTTEAIQWARHALQFDSTNAVAHYVLGCILARETGAKVEAVYHLEVAARELRAAAKALAALER